MDILREFVVSNKDLIILVAVGLFGFIAFISMLIKRRQEEEEYDERMASRDEMITQPTESIYDQDDSEEDEDDDDDDDDEQEDNTLVLKECHERVAELLEELDTLQNVQVEYFDEDQELSGEGYMYALIRFFLNGFESWIIFYPNFDYNLIVMLYNKRIPMDKVTEITDIIDEFYGDEATLIGETDEYPACTWDDDDNYHYSNIVIDLANAAKKNSVWYELLKQFQDD